MHVPDKSVPWFPYLVKGTYQDKVARGKYIKEEYCVLFPANGKEFFCSEGSFHCVLTPEESPYVLIVSSAKRIQPREFTIKFRTEHKITIQEWKK